MCHKRQQDKRWAYNLSCNVAADNYSVLGCEPSCFCGMVHSMAMLEAFVHDPLINWRLLNTTTDAVDAGNTPTADSSKCSNCACCVFIPCLALESSMCMHAVCLLS